MSGMAGNVTAFNTVFTYDLYQSYIHKGASDRHYMAVGRWATVGGILLSIATAYAAINFNNIMDTLQLVFSLCECAAVCDVFAGHVLEAGDGARRVCGLDCGHGGGDAASRADAAAGGASGHSWRMDRGAAPLPERHGAEFLGGDLCVQRNFVVTVVVSLLTKARPESELVGLVHSLTPKPPHAHLQWWKRPEALAVAILLGAVGTEHFLCVR